MDKKSTKIPLSQITTLEQALDQAPARSATEVSKGKAIGMLAPKLRALRAKGYAWRDVAAWLTEHGVTVTVPALQRYLRGVKLPAASRDAGRATGRRSSASSDGRPTTRDPAAASAEVRAVALQQEPKSAPAAGPVTTEAGARTPAQTRSGFTPRRDYEKI